MKHPDLSVGWTLLAIVCSALGAGCAEDSPAATAVTGGNTSWLQVCEEDADCDSGVCAGGMCSFVCEGDGECAELGPAAVCYTGSDLSRVSACSSQLPRAVCLLACSQDADCDGGDGWQCSSGYCRPSAETCALPTAGQGGGGSGGSPQAVPSGGSSGGDGSGGADDSMQMDPPSTGGNADASGGSDGSGGAVDPPPTDTAGAGGAEQEPPDLSMALLVSCADTNLSVDPEVQHAPTGSNGQFVDQCTPEGHLEQFGCGTNTDQDGNAVEPAVVPAGILDCDGRCVDGTCEANCPSVGESVRIGGLNEQNHVLIENLDDGRTYACGLTTPEAVDACATGAQGQTGQVTGLGLASQWCTGGVIGNFAAQVGGAGCSYSRCYLVYDDGLGDPPPPEPSILAPETIDCTNESGPFTLHAGLRAQVIGSDGSFWDECTPDGNLLEYQCEFAGDPCTRPGTEPLPNPDCGFSPTGVVSSRELDCDGRCLDGACQTGCPEYFNAVTVVARESDGRYQIANLDTGRDLFCELSEDTEGDAIDCTSVAGQPASVVTMGLSAEGLEGTCAGGVIGGLGLCFDDDIVCSFHHCSYTNCTIVP